MNAKEINALLDADVEYFTLPQSKFEVKFTKPDIVDEAIRGNLPTFIAEPILSGMKSSLKGKLPEETNLLEKEFTDAEIAELVAKSRILLKKLSIEPKFGDVSNDTTVAVNRIKTLDCLAFLQAAITSVRQEAETTDGGVVTSEEVINFSEGK